MKYRFILIITYCEFKRTQYLQNFEIWWNILTLRCLCYNSLYSKAYLSEISPVLEVRCSGFYKHLVTVCDIEGNFFQTYITYRACVYQLLNYTIFSLAREECVTWWQNSKLCFPFLSFLSFVSTDHHSSQTAFFFLLHTFHLRTNIMIYISYIFTAN